jgi:hypothetical protein
MLFIFILLAGCSDFNKAMQLQDDYASTFSVSDTSSPIFLPKEYKPKVTRGAISTEYSAVLPKGYYTPVASSAGRTFYQAPKGFAQLKSRKVESRVGGIVQVDKNDISTYYVWHFVDEIDYFEIQPNGDWIDDAKPGIANIATRPWIEADLQITLDDRSNSLLVNHFFKTLLSFSQRTHAWRFKPVYTPNISSHAQ